jgi:hypothetical protein
MTPKQKLMLEDAEAQLAKEQPSVNARPTSFQDIVIGQGFMFGFGDEFKSFGEASGAALANLIMQKPAAWLEEYDKALTERQAGIAKYKEENPKTALGAEIGGALANPLTFAGAGWAAKAPSFIKGLGRMAGVGAAEGGVSGAGHGVTPEGRAYGAAMGTTLGASLGVAVPAAASGVIKVIEVAARSIPGAAKREAAMKVAEAMMRDEITFEQALVRMRQIGGHSVLADIGENLRKLGGAAMRIPGQARTSAVKYLRHRQRGQHRRMIEDIRAGMGAEGGYHRKLADIMDARATAAKPMYDIAYRANREMMSPEISAILETPAGRKALKIAAKMMRNDRSFLGPLDPEMTAALREAVDLGKATAVPGGVAKGLRLRTLDYVKQALDGMVTVAYKKGGGHGGILAGLRDDFRAALDKADVTAPGDMPGAYRAARDIWAGSSHAMDTMEAGRKFMQEEAELTAMKMAKMVPGDKVFFKEGALEAASARIKSMKEGADKTAVALRTPAMFEKLGTVFDNPAEFHRWVRKTLGEEKMHKTFRELGGSPTAERLEEAANVGGGGTIRDLLWGAKGNVFSQMRLMQQATQGVRSMAGGPPRTAVADELSRMLVSPQGSRAALDAVRAAAPVAGARMAVPPALGAAAATQAYRPGLLLDPYIEQLFPQRRR